MDELATIRWLLKNKRIVTLILKDDKASNSKSSACHFKISTPCTSKKEMTKDMNDPRHRFLSRLIFFFIFSFVFTFEKSEFRLNHVFET